MTLTGINLPDVYNREDVDYLLRVITLIRANRTSLSLFVPFVWIFIYIFLNLNFKIYIFLKIIFKKKRRTIIIWMCDLCFDLKIITLNKIILLRSCSPIRGSCVCLPVLTQKTPCWPDRHNSSPAQLEASVGICSILKTRALPSVNCVAVINCLETLRIIQGTAPLRCLLGFSVLLATLNVCR